LARHIVQYLMESNGGSLIPQGWKHATQTHLDSPDMDENDKEEREGNCATVQLGQKDS